MKARKAIKRIAALGVGATMMGATLMGAMAADLSEYPGMFIEDGQFNGLLVVGKNAAAIDTIGVTNIALGLQKAAVTKTQVCGDATATTTTVSGEQVKIERTGEDLNIGEDLEDVQNVELDDGDLPSILADGEYDESEGEEDNDVTYTQEIELMDGTGTIVYDQDDSDAPEAGVYLLFDKNEDIYTYTLEFDDEVEYDLTDSDEDVESTTIELQGQKYTITDAEFTGADAIDKLTMMVGESVMWLAEGEVVTKDIDGVEHTIKMIDVANDATSCGFEVDGSSVWIDTDETETISGVTIGVTEAREVNVKDSDNDICKVFIGAAELVLENGAEVELEGDEIDGSEVTIVSDGSGTVGEWTSLTLTYDPDDDEYLAAGDELVDPIFGNFKFIMGGEVAVSEDIKLEASGDEATLSFLNYDDDLVEIPFAMNDDGSEEFVLGTEFDLGANPEDGFYTEGDICDGSGDITNCVGAQFLAVSSGDVAHVIEIKSIDENDEEIDFDDLTTGTSSDNNEYVNDGSDTDISLGSGVGTITLQIDSAAGTITFDTTELGNILTSNEGTIALSGTNAALNRDDFTFTENDDEGVEVTIGVSMTDNDDGDEIEINAPTGAGAGVKKSEDDDETMMYATTWGSIVEYDSDNEDDLTIMHPEEQLTVDVFVAETAATTSQQEGAGEGCTVSTTLNPIPSTVNKFDTEVSNPGAQNLVAVGGPCANSVSSALLGNPEVCYEGFEEGKAMLKLVESGSNVAIVVAGGTGKDTKLASTILQNYEDFELSGMEMVATTVSESGLKVEAAMADAPEEPME